MKGEAVPGFAFGDEFAVVGADGFAGQKQFQPDFFGGGTAGVKWIKDFFQGVGIQSVAVVAHGQAKAVFAGQDRRDFFGDVNDFQSDGDLAAPFVEVLPAVQAEVEQDLMDLRRIRRHRRQGGADAQVQFDFLRDDAAQYLERFFNGVLKGGQPEFHGRAQGKAADLVEKIPRPVARFVDLSERFMGRMIFGDIHRRQFSAAEDAGDDVVEFVRDAAGELVERLKFLGEDDFRRVVFCGICRNVLGRRFHSDFG